MPAEPLLVQLLDEIAASGRTPEEVCSAYPELLPEVRRRWRQMCAVEAELEALFPTPAHDPPVERKTPAHWHARGELPQIPGYDVQELIGHGGMGVVYKARHDRLNRIVALKMLIAGAYAGPSERARFQREAEAVASLQHPNIVAVYDVGEHEGCPYFTMEFLEGGSLAQALAGTPQPAGQATALLITLAEAVHAAHQAGIVHRDLKPANILITAEGAPKVADFGLARHVEGESALTLSGARIGTPSYMAPEQFSAKAGTIGPAADIYALGAVLYELLVGRPPFRGETAAETERQVIHEEPVSLSRLNTIVPRDLETICLKCLFKDPQRRYASAAALADDLRRFAEGRPIHARAVRWHERSGRWCRRNPTGAALLVTALALVGLASGGGVWLVQHRNELRNEVATTIAQLVQHRNELRNEVATTIARAASLRKGFHFDEARERLEQVRKRVERAGPADLRRQVDRASDQVDLAQRLDDARTVGGTLLQVPGLLQPARADALYAAAFADAGLGRDGDDSKAVAAAVGASAMRGELVAALDDWASVAPNQRRREWLLAVARSADPDVVRDRLRQPDLWLETARLARVAQELKVAEVSPQLATAVGRVLRASDGEAVALLTATQNRYPEDFWVAFELAWTLHRKRRSEESLGYFRAARALRPYSSAACNGIGAVLFSMGRVDEAIVHLESAIKLDAQNVFAYYSLCIALDTKRRPDEAVKRYRAALSIVPESPLLHADFGMFLKNRGQLDEAIEHLRKSLKLDRNSAFTQTTLAMALEQKGRKDEALNHAQEAVRLDANSVIAQGNLAILLRDRGRLAEAIDHFQQAVRIEGEQSSDARSRLVSTRFQAADANLGSAAATSSDDARGGEPERADKRRQALDWLRANFELTATLRSHGEVLWWSLAPWLSAPQFASVRDPAALAKLPDAERQAWQRLWTDVAANVAADPIEQARERAGRQQWDRAADAYARNLTRGPTENGDYWFECAMVSLLSGDRVSYARICAGMIEQCDKAGGPRPYHVARACTLAPNAVPDLSLAGRLAENELKYSAREFWSLTEQGALAYRAGRFQESVRLFEESLRANTKPGAAVLNWLWLALANQRLGRADEARRWLNNAQVWLDQFRDGMPARAEEELGLHLHNWLEAHVLRREAETLIHCDAPQSGMEVRESAGRQK